MGMLMTAEPLLADNVISRLPAINLAPGFSRVIARPTKKMEPKVPSETVNNIKNETRGFLKVYGEK